MRFRAFSNRLVSASWATRLAYAPFERLREEDPTSVSPRAGRSVTGTPASLSTAFAALPGPEAFAPDRSPESRLVSEIGRAHV